MTMFDFDDLFYIVLSLGQAFAAFVLQPLAVFVSQFVQLWWA